MARDVASAIILAVGSELTTGSTRDTNSGEIAAELTAMGVEVLRTATLPDRLERVADAFRRAIAEADLVVSTGGLGPTPDDLTREAICAATGRQPVVDPRLERALRVMFRRRKLAMPESNLKQAWLVPGADALPNPNGTAPGWWLELDDGTLVAALPGPPREMWPMWRDHVRPRLAERGAGAEVASETLRCAGIGESALADLIGEEVLRRAEPEVATYARPDAVDVRVSAHGPGAEQRVAAAVDELLGRIGDHVFARGAETWPEVIRRLLGGRTLALVEAGSGGQLLALLGAAPYVVGGELVGPDEFDEHGPAGLAERVRSRAGADVGLAVRTTAGRADTRVDVAIATATGAVHEQTRTAFLAGPEGQRRAALVAVTELWRWLSTDNYAHG